MKKSRPCLPGCTCGRHSQRYDPEELKTRGKRLFQGAATGDAFAQVLCPAGYVREFHVQYGPRAGQGYKLDFAHVEAKVNIELDGVGHISLNDSQRDSFLRREGWKVIRIKHG